MPPMAFRGIVTKAGFMDKTVTVTVNRFMFHRVTKKRIERSKKYLIHDPKNELRKDDVVIIRNCPPISARKRFMLEKLIRSPEGERQAAHALKDSQDADKLNIAATAAAAAQASGAFAQPSA